MGFWSKFAKVATGGIAGGGGLKGGLLNAATGGLSTAYGMARGRRGAAPMRSNAPRADSLAFFRSQSPADQESIRQSWGSNPNAMNDWFDTAKAAGSVPAAPPAAPMPISAMPGGGMPMRMPAGLPPDAMRALVERFRPTMGGPRM